MSAGDCGRCLIVLINIALFAAALAFFVSQAFFVMRYASFFQSMPFIITVTIAAAFMLILFFGCLAACCDHRIMVFVYTFFMFVFIGLSTYAFFQYGLKYHSHDDKNDKLKEDLSYAYDNYSKNVYARRIIDDIQRFFMCCGLMSFNDKALITSDNSVNNEVFKSCCTQNDLRGFSIRPSSKPRLNKNNRRDVFEEDVLMIPENHTSNILRYDQTYSPKRNIIKLTENNDNESNHSSNNKNQKCLEIQAKNSHDKGCYERLREYEPYLFYFSIAFILISAVGALSGVMAAFDCGSDGHSIHIRTSRRRN